MVVFIASIKKKKSDDDHTLCTSTQMKEWAKEAEKSNTPKYGVKGISPLFDFLDLPACIPIDYMHSIHEGAINEALVWAILSFREIQS